MHLDGDSEDRHVHLADLSTWEAVSSPAFWVFALSSSVFGLVYSGISLFNHSILEQRGFNATTYHVVLVISTMLGLVANFAGGWLASRWSIQKLIHRCIVNRCGRVVYREGQDIEGCINLESPVELEVCRCSNELRGMSDRISR